MTDRITRVRSTTKHRKLVRFFVEHDELPEEEAVARADYGCLAKGPPQLIAPRARNAAISAFTVTAEERTP